jgi:DNA-binding Lrp family transcriptional regulator
VYRSCMIDLLEFEPVRKFVDTVGKDIERYFGKDKGALIYLKPNGVWYAQGLCEWLRKERKKDVTVSAMEDNGKGLEIEKVRGRKVLVVDADIVTGKAYKRSTEGLRLRKKELQIKEVKFATYIDRMGLADFFVWKYSSESIWHLDELDALDLQIVSFLTKDGRASFAEIGKKVNLSSVAVKNRVDKLLRERIIRIQAGLNLDQFYTTSALIYIEADIKTVEKFIEKFEKIHGVHYLVRVTGIYNLCVGIATHSWHDVQAFIEQEVRPNPGVKKIFITTGEVPILPKTVPLRSID